jgi:hypothetical protein
MSRVWAQESFSSAHEAGRKTVSKRSKSLFIARQNRDPTRVLERVLHRVKGELEKNVQCILAEITTKHTSAG